MGVWRRIHLHLVVHRTRAPALACAHDREPGHAAGRHLRARHRLARLPRIRPARRRGRRASSSPRLADLREPRTTIGGVNLVVGVAARAVARPRRGAGARRAARLRRAGRRARTASRCRRPSTTLVLWLAGRGLRRRLRRGPHGHRGARAGRPRSPTETSSWPYRHDRDLTGFIDGTENPSLARAPDVASSRRRARCGRVRAAAAAVAARRRRVGGAARRGPGGGDGAHQGRLDRTRPQARRTRTSPAPTRTSSATSSAATCPTAR